jgi:hypothetical protein
MSGHSRTQPSRSKNLELLIRCLHRYVELNPRRFGVCREKGQKRVVMILVEKEKS